MQLTIHHLSFERNNILLFNQICCALQPGSLCEIRGVNGSGKSTLLRILGGFIEPQEGAICWEGVSIFKQRDLYQQQTCFIGHQNGVKPYLTVYENLALSCLLAGNNPKKISLETALTKIGLLHAIHKPTFQLSAGLARRLALARLIIQPAKLWILDEPTTALDAAGQQLLNDLLHQHLAKGGIAMIATHQDLPKTQDAQTLWLGDGARQS